MDELGEQQYPDIASRPFHGEPHLAYAWLSVNRAGHYNCMHVHDKARWSAVYYVHEGEACPHDANCSGRLIFRGGPSKRRRLDGDELGRAAHGAATPTLSTHSFLAVPPEPGALWLFPGGIPHAVMPTSHAGSRQGRRDLRAHARISVAINFEEAMAPESAAAH